MTKMTKVFRYHSGLDRKTYNFAFEVKVILYYHSTRPDVLMAKINRVRWPLWMIGLRPEDSFRV